MSVFLKSQKERMRQRNFSRNNGQIKTNLQIQEVS